MAGSRLVKDFAKDITHVICGVNDDGHARHDLRIRGTTLCCKQAVLATSMRCLHYLQPTESDMSISCLAQEDSEVSVGGPGRQVGCRGVVAHREPCCRQLCIGGRPRGGRCKPSRQAHQSLKTALGVTAVTSMNLPLDPSWHPCCRAPSESQHDHVVARQVSGDASGQLGGPALGRLNRDAGGAQLLSSHDVFLEGAFADAADIAVLLKAAGAKLLSRAPLGGSASQGRTVVVLVDDSMPSQPGAES